jgi:glycyl-tRNA synthetase
MSKPLSFQQVIMRLDHYWADHGCLIWQPYSEKVGAGTANPATTLRVLGPEPWKVGYVEPSYRADDGRYAENPNRMQMHTQYQVILKPDPGNPQELYLGSLEAIGINMREHDVRFVEDRWESPALGAWGLGWEVWLDGQEISQYTYFQQAGGLNLDPVPVELTYGLERIVMYLQKVRAVWDIDWDGVHIYGDIYRRPEVEHCIYNFELADVDRLNQMYGLYEAEARACMERGLVIPAYDYVLRCSHTFNLLDARGAIGVTERAFYFGRMRDLSRQIARLYVQQREEMGFPFLQGQPAAGAPQAARETARPPAATAQPETFLLEIGTEELPTGDLTLALEQLRTAVPRMLDEARLGYDEIQVMGTPRRQAVLVYGLQPRQPDQILEVQGPPARAAYDAAGQPTRAAEGFTWSLPRFKRAGLSGRCWSKSCRTCWPASAFQRRSAGTRPTSPFPGHCAGWSPSSRRRWCRSSSQAWPAGGRHGGSGRWAPRPSNCPGPANMRRSWPNSRSSWTWTNAATRCVARYRRWLPPSAAASPTIRPSWTK